MATHKFSELRDKMHPDRQSKIEARVQETLAEMPLCELHTQADEVTHHEEEARVVCAVRG